MYRYIRAMTVRKPFEGAAANLIVVFTQNRKRVMASELLTERATRAPRLLYYNDASSTIIPMEIPNELKLTTSQNMSIFVCASSLRLLTNC